MSDPLGHAIEQVTREPILGPRQGALVDAFTARLSSGFPLTQPDLVAYINTAQFLGIQPVPPAPPQPAPSKETEHAAVQP